MIAHAIYLKKKKNRPLLWGGHGVIGQIFLFILQNPARSDRFDTQLLIPAIFNLSQSDFKYYGSRQIRSGLDITKCTSTKHLQRDRARETEVEDSWRLKIEGRTYKYLKDKIQTFCPFIRGEILDCAQLFQ
jgi:hypothetical protein